MKSISMAITVLFLLMFMTAVSPAQENSETKPRKKILRLTDKSLSKAVSQYKHLMQRLPEGRLPRSVEDGRLLTSSRHAWTSGFYPGTLLYLYEFSGDTTLYQEAIDRLQLLQKLQHVTTTHDLGFMMYCSYGNAYRISGNEDYKNILVQTARSLATRFDPEVGCIKSWDNVMSMDGKTVWEFPVIIDNMMNLELLFFASQATGDPKFKEMAISHAETTLRNHVRPDYSTYHVVNYDPETGAVKTRETHQGFSNNSTWARGQAWGIYGFTMTFRETKDEKFLKAAREMADFFLEHGNLPDDKIPYWDFNVGQEGYEPHWEYDPDQYETPPRDASAAAITASALIELAGYVNSGAGERYLKAAEDILVSLSSPAYRTTGNVLAGFLLKHNVGGMPSHAEVDVPLTYADYYYVEAMLRYKNLAAHGTLKLSQLD